MPEHLHIPDFILYFLKFFIRLCVLYGRIARLKWQVFAGEPAGVLIGFRLLSFKIWIVRFVKMR
jgi:hypothetical protein